MIRQITKEECKELYPLVYNIMFLGIGVKEKPVSDRRRGESLHEYFTRKQLKCFCPKCRNKPVAEQGSLL